VEYVVELYPLEEAHDAAAAFCRGLNRRPVTDSEPFITTENTGPIIPQALHGAEIVGRAAASTKP